MEWIGKEVGTSKYFDSYGILNEMYAVIQKSKKLKNRLYKKKNNI